jgi:hypothetical protein
MQVEQRIAAGAARHRPGPSDRRVRTAETSSTGSGTLLRRGYYFLKPYLPWTLRVALRRVRARRRRRQFDSSWPVDLQSSRTPEGWPGWPGGKRFAVVLTHDVEGSKGVARCQQLAHLEGELNFRSSFNFIPEGEYRVSEQLRDWLVENSFEVGVHDLKHDGKLYSSEAAFSASAEKINQYLKRWNAVGFRSGFMHHNLRWIGKLNILYDASTFDTDPFEPQPDGVGTIFPFWVRGEEGRGGYVELPYTLVQDFTLFVVLRERTIDLWKRKLDWIATQGGMALVNVHPDYVCFDGQPAAGEFPASLYRQFLEYVRSEYGERCWIAVARDVAEYAIKNRSGLWQEIQP